MGDKKILICDDSRSIRMLTTQCLSDIGYQVIGEACNGIEAIDQYQALSPDAVLLDLVMPEMDGKTALERILALDPQANIIVLSSLGKENDVETCLRSGAKGFLQKPLDPETLQRALNTIFT